MNALVIKKAERIQRKFKGALAGPSGSGKTWTALELASGLIGEGRILVIDSERSSSTLYADKFDFEILDMPNTNYQTYLEAIEAGVAGGFDVIIIDSLSHAWEDLVEEADRVAKRDRSKNSFTAWAEVAPIYKRLVQAIVAAPCHVIATFRSKTDYVMEEYTDKQGKTRTKPVKVGLAPIFRQGGEYEFDVVANIDLDHNFTVEKTRVNFLDGMVEKKVGKKLGLQIRDWLNSGKKEEPIVADANPLEYKIETRGSSMFGKTISEAIKIDPSWVPRVQTDTRVQAKLSKRDLLNVMAVEVEIADRVAAHEAEADDLPASFSN